jgi:hypothetical protein
MIYIRSSLVELDPQPNAFGSGMLSQGSPGAACELQGIVTHLPGSGFEGLSLGHFRPQRRQRSLILGLHSKRMNVAFPLVWFLFLQLITNLHMYAPLLRLLAYIFKALRL